MDQMINTLLTQSPIAAAVIVVAIFFLKEMRAMRADYTAESQTRMASIRELSAECHEHSRAISERCSSAVDRNTEMLGRCIAVIDQQNKKP